MLRREFLQLAARATALGALTTLAPSKILFGRGTKAAAKQTLTILHTNDVHSRIEPFPDNAGRNAGKGGVARRATLIDKIRREKDNVILLDAGDFFQGTPYFNFYQGKLEIELMSKLGYEAATLGNHDFDAGLEVLAQRIREATFPIVVCNYDFTDTPVAGLTKEYIILKKKGLKVGVYGVGINPKYWIIASIAEQFGFKDPVANAQRVEKLLHDKGCDYIICLSHLGLTSRYNTDPGDVDFAPQTRYTDLIIGGHTHTFLDEPKKFTNLAGKEILVNQVGWAGIRLGQVEVEFSPSSKKARGGSQEVS